MSRSLARRVRVAPALIAVACAGILSACDVHGLSEPGSLSTLSVSPNPQSLAANGSQQFTATGKDFAGNAVASNATWSVVAGGGTISPSGLFTAGGTAGTFASTVKATSGSLSATATVIVMVGPLATITVTPNPASVAVGGTQQYTAVGKDAGGNVVAITPAWSIVANGGAIDSATGLFTAGSVPGTYTNSVRASSGSIAGVATVTVTAGPLASITVTPNPDTTQAGGTKQFVALGKDAGGNAVAITPTWSVTNGGGTIAATTGLFTAGNTPGAYVNTITATSGAISGKATEIVLSPNPLSLSTITVTPNPASLLPNATQQFTAVGKDGNGTPVTIAPVWSVVSGGGTIDAATGLFTAGPTVGTYTNTVRATSGTISGTATVTVTTTPTPPPSSGTIDLGTAAANGIMAGTAVTCITGGLISADVSISPGSTLTGFGPCVITGVKHLADAVAAKAQVDLIAAYNTLAGLPCPPANFISANLGGTTKTAGVYCSATGIGVTGILTLDGGGDSNAQFVFQAGTGLTTAGDVVLINGAQAKNVYWLVGSSATIGTASKWQGNIVALTSITLVDNATLLGRALARNGAVTLGTNNVITLP
jgi:hypothetical protein